MFVSAVLYIPKRLKFQSFMASSQVNGLIIGHARAPSQEHCQGENDDLSVLM